MNPFPFPLIQTLALGTATLNDFWQDMQYHSILPPLTALTLILVVAQICIKRVLISHSLNYTRGLIKSFADINIRSGT